MAEEIKIDNISAIKERIRETERQINDLTEKIKSKEDEKAKVSANFEDKKKDYEEYRRQFVYQSTSGVYFLAVSFIAFVFVAYNVLNHSMVAFMIIPAAVLLAAGILGKIKGDAKFQKMKVVMDEKEMSYQVAKEGYDLFMKDYNSDVALLNKKQYEWENVENNMIEAKKDAWIAQQKKAAEA